MDEAVNLPLQDQLIQYQDQLLMLASRNLNPVLRQRFSPEDVVQEVFANAYSKKTFFEQAPEIPIYSKLRRIFFQTLKDLERKHLRSECRDAYKDAYFVENNQTEPGGVCLESIPEECAGPMTLVAREDQHHLLKIALNELSESDREIIEMRHFDECSNAQCASLLNLSPKATSIRYIRALERLQTQLLKFTEFHL
jgi:RNA polymerase sigma-70 factor (ECF subfamily)